MGLLKHVVPMVLGSIVASDLLVVGLDAEGILNWVPQIVHTITRPQIKILTRLEGAVEKIVGKLSEKKIFKKLHAVACQIACKIKDLLKKAWGALKHLFDFDFDLDFEFDLYIPDIMENEMSYEEIWDMIFGELSVSETLPIFSRTQKMLEEFAPTAEIIEEETDETAPIEEIIEPEIVDEVIIEDIVAPEIDEPAPVTIEEIVV